MVLVERRRASIDSTTRPAPSKMKTDTGLLLFAFLIYIGIAQSFVPASPNHYHGCYRQKCRLANCFESSSSRPETADTSVTNVRKEQLSPAFIDTIDTLVAKRADARSGGDYVLADTIRAEIESLNRSSNHTIPPGYRIELTDVPRKHGGGSTWDLVPEFKEAIERVSLDEDSGESVLQLSHAAIGLATMSAEGDVQLNSRRLDAIVSKALARLERTGPTELRGRKAADAAFWFALAGISDDTAANASKLYDSLSLIATEELKRFGHRPSCRAKDVMHIVERLYAAGITGDLAKQLSRVAADCLVAKDFKGRNTSTNAEILELLNTNNFDMHSDRPLLWIWRFSIRQRKQRSFLRGAAKHYERFSGRSLDERDECTKIEEEQSQTYYEWEELFDDPSLPLVVDIGCGMGVSLHGLATLGKEEQEVEGSSQIDLDWKRCNYIGVDLSRLAVGFANSIASRWGVSGRLTYVVDSAEGFLEEATKTYPGGIQLVLIQFPTPFRLQKLALSDDDHNENDDEIIKGAAGAAKGNLQLPKHPHGGFMVTGLLLRLAREALRPSSGRLLLQSNCEDVAVYMRKLATEEAAFSVVPLSNHITSFDSFNQSKIRIPQRTVEHIKMGGERAVGEGWSAHALLPKRGATETEVACFLERTPVHRCLLAPKGEKDGPSAY